MQPLLVQQCMNTTKTYGSDLIGFLLPQEGKASGWN
jgi:hypothetical protein